MDFLNDVWATVRPHAVTAAAAAALGLISLVSALIAGRVSAALKAIEDDKLALSLYRTIENGLKAIIARRVLSGADLGRAVTGAIVREAIDFTKENNAKAVAKLDQSDGALHEKVLARLPEAKAAVVAAADKVRPG